MSAVRPDQKPPRPAVSTDGDFSVGIGRIRSTVVVTLNGVLDSSASAFLAGLLEDLIDDQGNLDLAIDLRGLTRMGPSGPAVMATAAAHIDRHGGALRLRTAPGAVTDRLFLAGLSEFARGRTVDEDVIHARSPRRPTRPCQEINAHPAGSWLNAAPR